jgi:hypothetical protein
MEKDNASTLKTLNVIPGQSGLKATYAQMKKQSERKLKANGSFQPHHQFRQSP